MDDDVDGMLMMSYADRDFSVLEGEYCEDLDNIKIIIEIIILINYLMDMDGLKTWNSMEDVLDLGSMKRIS